MKAKIVKKISIDNINWFCSVALKKPVCDISQKTNACKKIALLTQPNPKVWNKNLRLDGGLNISIQKTTYSKTLSYLWKTNKE